MKEQLKIAIENEISQAAEMQNAGDLDAAFHHLERAHVLGQTSTYYHTRVHCLMLKVGVEKRDKREVAGQLFRIAGASTKTPLGIYPKGNTGGANVSPFKPMPIAPDLQKILEQ